jgi:hypothetical protein
LKSLSSRIFAIHSKHYEDRAANEVELRRWLNSLIIRVRDDVSSIVDKWSFGIVDRHLRGYPPKHQIVERALREYAEDRITSFAKRRIGIGTSEMATDESGSQQRVGTEAHVVTLAGTKQDPEANAAIADTQSGEAETESETPRGESAPDVSRTREDVLTPPSATGTGEMAGPDGLKSLSSDRGTLGESLGPPREEAHGRHVALFSAVLQKRMQSGEGKTAAIDAWLQEHQGISRTQFTDYLGGRIAGKVSKPKQQEIEAAIVESAKELGLLADSV